ncbi:hypothetical protein Athai_66880 [Actinocatenispora thailandica]|uniref:Uncharacterized protein n=1 Tax=Actinocatenispora thailandica TaxID=227318 RepID=A0A7R7DX25_9ACTN|nr:hypothetical protein [Actinocatenispora thailandica]BCJ39185.1 hypothetical protein Athai_66880 [Actinocatenispora thailandica]
MRPRYRLPLLPTLLISAALMTLVWSALTGYKTVVFLGGDQVTAHIHQCETHNSSRGGTHTTCYGSWQDSQGATHHGTVDGAGSSDSGSDVPVRALGNAAELDDGLTVVPYLIVEALFLILTIVLAVIVVAKYRGRKRAPFPPGRLPGPVPRAWPPRRR